MEKLLEIIIKKRSFFAYNNLFWCFSYKLIWFLFSLYIYVPVLQFSQNELYRIISLYQKYLTFKISCDFLFSLYREATAVQLCSRNGVTNIAARNLATINRTTRNKTIRILQPELWLPKILLPDNNYQNYC